MKTMTLLAVLGACGTESAPDGNVNAQPSVPTPQGATIIFEFANRGAYEDEAFPWLAVLSADEGESCVSSWMTNFLAPAWIGMESFPIPTEPYVGMVYAIPDEIPESSSAVPFYFPPTFYFDGDVVAWFGGTWTFTEWSEDIIEVVLAGGVTCEYDLGTYYAQPETCLADSGTIFFNNEDGDGPLEAEDPGYRGYPAAAIDPRSGDPLCQRISSAPSPDEGAE